MKTVRKIRLATCAGALAVASGLPTAVAATPSAAAAPQPAPFTVTVDESVSTPPSKLVTEVAAKERARIVSAFTTSAGLRIGAEDVVGNAAARAAVKRAQARPGAVAIGVDQLVQYVTPEGRKIFKAAAAAKAEDPGRIDQWGHDRLEIEDAWQHSTGQGVTVAVVDTGVDGNHPDLVGQVLPGTDTVGANSDGRYDVEGHGTHVSGIVAAIANNQLGVAGSAPAAKILPVRVLDSNGSGYASDIAEGVIYAADRADIINLSLGSTMDDPVLRAAVEYALSKGRLVFAASGNDGKTMNAVSYPAAIPGVSAVGSIDQDGQRSDFSSWGRHIDFAAPGRSILSTFPNERLAVGSGTSMATPYAAGVAAIALSIAKQSGLDGDDVLNAMRQTAHDVRQTKLPRSAGGGAPGMTLPPMPPGFRDPGLPPNIKPPTFDFGPVSETLEDCPPNRSDSEQCHARNDQKLIGNGVVNAADAAELIATGNVAPVPAPEGVPSQPTMPTAPWPTPAPPEAPAPGTFTTKLTKTSDWVGGYCATVAVSTNSEKSVLWNVEVPLEGSRMDSLWSAAGAFQNGVLYASGAGWNNLVSKGKSQSFGFCMTR